MNLSCLSGSLVLQSIFYLPAPETVFLGDLERWPQTGLTRYRGPPRTPSSTFSSDLQGRYAGNRPQRTPAQLRAQARAGGVGSWLEPVPSSCRRKGGLLQGGTIPVGCGHSQATLTCAWPSETWPVCVARHRGPDRRGERAVKDRIGGEGSAG